MDKQSAPQQEYVSPPGIVAGQRPMSAPRTNAAIAEDLSEWRKGIGSMALKAVMMEAIAALRKEPPALPAEVEAVLAKLDENCQCLQRPTFADPPCAVCKGKALLRRYAQAVAEKDADSKHFRARVFLASSHGASAHSTGCTIWGDDGQGHTEEGFTQPLPCNCGALINFHKKEVATLQREAREKDAEIARLTEKVLPSP